VIKNGVPYDVAYSLSSIELAAHSIVFSEFNLPEDQYFDFTLMRFREPKK